VRKAFVNLILAAFIIGSAYDIITDREHWPFSQYPMFAEAWESPTFVWLRVFGVTADGNEFPLDANRFVAPFDQSRLPKALRRIREQPDADARIHRALRDVMTRYEQLRLESDHEGPPVVAMRLYELEWTIDRSAGNVNRPERKTFIGEVRR
jgi:hypothetical protein